jgi:tetratricopeptide (TPR) repeat protein
MIDHRVLRIDRNIFISAKQSISRFVVTKNYFSPFHVWLLLMACFVGPLFTPLALHGQSQQIDEWKQKLAQTEDVAVQMRLCQQLGYTFMFYDYNQAERFNQKAIALYQKTQLHTVAVEVYAQWGQMVLNLSKIEQADSLISKGLFIAQEEAPASIPFLLTLTAKVNQSKGYYKEAIETLNLTISMADSLQNLEAGALAWYSLSTLYGKLGDRLQSIQCLEKSYDINIQLGSVEGQIGCLSQLGFNHKLLNNLKLAKNYGEKALELASKHEMGLREVEVLNNLGAICITLKDYKLAIIYLNRAKQKLMVTPNPRMSVYVNQYLAIAYQWTNEFPKAKTLLDTAFAIAVETRDSTLLANMHAKWGEYYKHANEYEKSEEHYLTSIHLFEQIGNENSAANEARGLAVLYEKWGKHDMAYPHLHRYVSFTDSLMPQSTIHQISKMEARFWSQRQQQELLVTQKEKELQIVEAEKAKAETAHYHAQRNLMVGLAVLVILFISGLYYINSRRKKSRMQELIAQSELKALRAQMNPHFIFNTLGAIQLMIRENNEKLAEESITKFSKLIRMVLENSEKKAVTIEDEIEALELYIAMEALRFDFEYQIQVAEHLDVAYKEIPSMVIQPYVENAIKHGLYNKFNGGKLEIVLEEEGDTLRCKIQDNGVGRAHTMKTNASHKSMGTNITKQRLELLSSDKSKNPDPLYADLVSDSGEPKGTRVEILIPILT